MKSYFHALTILVFFVSCSEDGIGYIESIRLSVNLNDSYPNENQDKILEVVEGFISEESSIKESQYVLKATYDEKTVFVFGNCCPYCNSLPPAVYDCSGEFLGRIEYFGNPEEELTVPNDEIINRTLFWPEDPTCNF